MEPFELFLRNGIKKYQKALGFSVKVEDVSRLRKTSKSIGYTTDESPQVHGMSCAFWNAYEC